MEIFQDLFANKLLFAPIFAWLTAQILKVIIHSIVERKFSLKRFFGDGGMPSGHSATVTSILVMCGWCAGFSSPLFALAFVFAIIVMHDASGVRLETGKQATVIKQLTEAFNYMFFEKDEEIRTEKLKEFVGHTPTQVFFGSLVGIIVAIICISVSGLDYECMASLGTLLS